MYFYLSVNKDEQIQQHFKLYLIVSLQKPQPKHTQEKTNKQTKHAQQEISLNLHIHLTFFVKLKFSYGNL